MWLAEHALVCAFNCSACAGAGHGGTPTSVFLSPLPLRLQVDLTGSIGSKRVCSVASHDFTCEEVGAGGWCGWAAPRLAALNHSSCSAVSCQAMQSTPPLAAGSPLQAIDMCILDHGWVPRPKGLWMVHYLALHRFFLRYRLSRTTPTFLIPPSLLPT